MVCIRCGAATLDELPFCPNCHHGVDPRGFFHDSRPSTGVHGWLAVLVFILVVLRPLAAMLGIGAVVVLHRLPNDWKSPAVLILTVASLALTCVGLYVGIQLKRIAANAVRTAKRYFFALGIYWTSILLMALLGVPMHLTTVRQRPLGVVDFVWDIGWAAAWYLYLVRSKRVAATYPLLTAPSQ